MKYRILSLLIAVLLLSGCSQQPVSQPQTTVNSADPEVTAPETNDSSIPFVPSTEVLSGGTHMTGTNLRHLEVTQTEDITQIRMTFVDGSDLVGISEAELPEVPAWSTDWYEGADRLLVHLKGVLFFDYQLDAAPTAAGLVQGMFAMQAGNEEESLVVIQAGERVEYAVEAHKNILTISLRAVGEEQNNVYSISLNGYERYFSADTASQWGEMGFAPCLCSDLTSTVLLSVPFADESSAQQYLEEVRQDLSSLLPGLVPEIVSYASNRLPEYNPESALSSLAQRPVIQKDGEEITSPVLIHHGTYLCSLEDGSGIVFSRQLPSNSDEDFPYEELLVYRNGKEIPVLDGFEFTSVSSACASSDSSYLAVCEQTLNLDVTVVSLEDGEVFIPAEDGQWKDLVSCCWHDKLPILYCLAQNDDECILYAYDLTDPSRPSVSRVGEDSWDSVGISFANGKIWSLQRDEDMQMKVCALDPESGEYSFYQSAHTLLVSPDGSKYLALADTDDPTSLRALFASTSDGMEITSFEASYWVDLAWDQDSEHLYAGYFDEDSWQDEYPMTIIKVNVTEGVEMPFAYAKAGALYTAPTPGQIYMLYIFFEQNQSIPMTYILN